MYKLPLGSTRKTAFNSNIINIYLLGKNDTKSTIYKQNIQRDNKHKNDLSKE